MNDRDRQQRIFGPYDHHPFIYISHSETDSSLKRIIYEESEVLAQQPKLESKTNNEMTWKQVFLYYLFLYTPPKEHEFPSQTQERKFLGEEVLCESVLGFEIIGEHGKYYVRVRKGIRILVR